MQCEICSRTPSHSKIQLWANKQVCTACKSLFYRQFDKIYSQVLENENCSFDLITDFIWNGFLSSNVCEKRNKISSDYVFCSKNEHQLLNCSKCRFRRLFFCMPPPRKQFPKSENKQNFLKLKKWWDDLLKILSGFCQNGRESIEPICRQVLKNRLTESNQGLASREC